MAKSIYSSKIILLRKHFNINKQDIQKFMKVCEFIIFIYVKAWFRASSAIDAPKNDMIFFKEIKEWASIDAAISKQTVQKMKGHLWYISPELCGLSLFDERVSYDIKRKMVLALQKAPENENTSPKKFIIENMTDEEFISKDLDFFIDK